MFEGFEFELIGVSRTRPSRSNTGLEAVLIKNRIVSRELLSKSTMLSKATSQGIQLIDVAVDAISVRVLLQPSQAVLRTVYSALDRLRRTECEKIISKPNRKGRRIEPCRKLCVRLTDLDFRSALRLLKHKLRGLKPPATYLTRSYFHS